MEKHAAMEEPRELTFDCRRPAMEPALQDRSNDHDQVVLVIDDDPDVREGLRDVFESVNSFGANYPKR